MQIVIDIPDEYKKQFDKNRCEEKFDSLATNEFGYILRKAFENSTPLSKGHGRLIDADAIIEEAIDMMKYSKNRTYMECVIAWMNLASTIIEADKESEDENADSD